MTIAAVLKDVTEALDHAGIPYMLTGSVAANFYGRPRATADIDFVIAADAGRLKTLIHQLREKQYYAELEDALDAWRHNSMFNALDDSMAWKIDFIMRKPDSFNRQEFQRRVAGDIQGVPVVISTAEDLVIAKLNWAKQGESHRQVEDVANILKIQRESLQLRYIEQWVKDLDLAAQWISAKQAAGLE